jgi:hypothetical protein
MKYYSRLCAYRNCLREQFRHWESTLPHIIQLLQKKKLEPTSTTIFDEFNIHVSEHRNNILVYKSQTDAHVTEFIFVWELLYMFRVSLSTIFSSTKKTVTTAGSCGWPTPPTTHTRRFQLFHDSSRQQYGVMITRWCSYSCFVLLKMGERENRNT